MPPLTARQMRGRAERLLELPKGFSKISSGLILPDNDTVITGHQNGYVCRWKLGSNKPDILLRATSEIHALTLSSSGGLFIGCNAGDLYLLSRLASGGAEQILPPTGSKYDRVFRIADLGSSKILITSTYGVLKLLRRTDHGWQAEVLSGHSNAVFAVAHNTEGWLATGDYRGNVLVWKSAGESYELRQRLFLDSYVSGLAFLQPSLLAAVAFSGHVYLFEFEASSGAWKPAFETDTASGHGADIQPAADGRSIIAATADEAIRVDPGSQQIEAAAVKGTITVAPRTNDLLIFTEDSVASLPLTAFKPKLDVVRFRYLKVSLLGNTAFGKSTLSSAITTGNPGTHLSTFGHRVWTWTVDSNGSRRRILLNDIGGQDQVIATSLHMAADSDVVLFFFKQTDMGGFRTALDLHRTLRPLLSRGAKTYLVETFTDHTLKAVSDDFVGSQSESESFDGLFKICPLRQPDVERFKTDFVRGVDWSRARQAVQSASAEGILKTIAALKLRGVTVIGLDEVKSEFERVTGTTIYQYHLKFLLQNLTDLGEVEYYPSVSDRVVIDDPEFNELRTNIPVYASEKGGILRVGEVPKRFPDSNPAYIAMLDRYYVANGVAIPFADDTGRIFPIFLESRPLRISEAFSGLLESAGPSTSLRFRVADFDLSRLIHALCDMDLNCQDATSNEGLFSWGHKAAIYYHVEQSRSTLTGPVLKIDHKVASRDGDARKSLTTRFTKLLSTFYGAPLPDNA